MKKRRIKGIQMIPYGLLAGVMTEDSIEERQREVRLTEISSEGFRIRLCRRGKAEENIYPKAFKICFYQMDQAEYREIEIRHFQIEAGEQTEFYQAYDIFTVQEDYKEAFQKLCVEYSRYISLKLEEDDAREYQMDIYHTVLLKDVIMRNQIRNVPFLENLVRFLADNTGKLISANSISKYMKSQGESIASAAIINYISFLCEAYILHKVNRYDIHGKRIFETNDKFYFEDNGIRNAIAGGTREGDIEKVIENIIYQNLIRLGYQVYVGQLQAGEIDFVCTKPGGERIYVQASYIIADDATREREFGNLRAIKDNYPKYVISMTPLLTKNDNDGITHLHLRKFLTEGI